MPEEQILSPDIKREAVRHTMKRFSEWERSMERWRRGRERLDRRYHNYREDMTSIESTAGNQPRANIGVPLAAETVDTANARSYDTFFRTSPYGKVWGREETDEFKAGIVQQVLDYQMQITGLPNTALKIFKDAYKYGLGVGKLHFKVETNRVPVPQTIMGIPVGVTMQEKVVMESPVLSHVHIQDIFFPRDAVDVDDAEGIIHRTWLTKEQIMTATDGLGMPLYDAKALNFINQGASTSSKTTDDILDKEYTTRKIDEGGLKKEDSFKTYEATIRLPHEISTGLVEQFYPGHDPFGDWLITWIDGNDYPLRVEPNPYLTRKRMYIFTKVIDDPGYLAGISIVEFVERLGLTIDELYNIVLDNMNYVNNKQYYVNEFAGVDEADVVSSPGKVIRGTRPYNEAMAVIQTPDISQSVFIVLNQLLGHYKEYTGITNPILGQSASGDQTATEIASIVRNSSTRLGQFERMLEDTFMRPLFEKWTILNQQFLDAEFTVRVFKDGQPVYPKVAPEDVQGIFDFKFEGASRSESIALLTGQIMQMLQINATQPVPIFDPVYLGKKLTDAWGWTDAERALNPMFQEQYQMFQQLQALRNIGETAKALTPEQQKQQAASNGDKARQGNAAQPNNTQTNKDFNSALTAVQETALPQQPNEG